MKGGPHVGYVPEVLPPLVWQRGLVPGEGLGRGGGWAAHCRSGLEEQQHQGCAGAEVLVGISWGAGVPQTSPALVAAAQPLLQAPAPHLAEWKGRLMVF